MQYILTDLKKQFKKLADAKSHFSLKASSWDALVEKLNNPVPHPSPKPKRLTLKEQVIQLQDENKKLKNDIETLKTDFDPVGFWLLDNNFDRSRFGDFITPDDATRLESVAKNFYKKLADRYHPDKGGSNEQMNNVKKLLDQMMGMVEINEGLGK